MADVANERFESPGGTPEGNSIRPSKKRRQEGSAANPARKTAAAPGTATYPTDAVPEAVRRRFVVVKNRYHFPDGTHAFTDHGTRLTTSSENTEVIKSLIQIAEARGWREIAVRGTERFRQEAWFTAQLSGMEVTGHRPSAIERERLARVLARDPPPRAEEAVAPASEPPTAPSAREGLLDGRLLDHGRATYRHDPRQPMSYFVKLETPRGERTIWGVDLERAFKESLTKPGIGDRVGLRALRQEAVQVRREERDSTGERIERALDTHRNHWIIERRAFFNGRKEAAQLVRDSSLSPKQAAEKRPELVGTLLQVHLAKLAAAKLHSDDRDRFVTDVRSALADRIARGEPLPVVRLRERAPGHSSNPLERERAPVRG
jgi:hypothetical protein